MTVEELIRRDFNRGWRGCADDWWAQNRYISTINSIAPIFTLLKQTGVIEPVERVPTRHGGMAMAYRKAR